MNIEGTRFGNIEYTTEDVIQLPEGLIGFANLKHFVLVNPKADSPFRWFQSIEAPAWAFLITDPSVYISGYDPRVDESVVKSLDLEEDTPRLLYTTVCIPHGQPEEMTLNLSAPIVINAVSRRAKQIVLDDHAYTIKHRVFQTADRAGERQAA
ncbi:MAG TPA: flagellar assembly protein FliW [Fimbriimonadaceae bacterium]|jgi:flagellar assembly factor FliW